MQRYDRVPEHMQSSLKNYVEEGKHPGGFLNAVLSNDLVNAFGKADGTNQKAMKEWTLCLYNDIPANCWGSPERVDEWIEQGGLSGKREVEQ